MTTASILESYNNRPGFELLATSVLRKVKPTCAGIIHTGMNAQGETIVSPIDGLRLIPNSNPPHYVFVHHTTTDRDRLREKWLTGKHADLPKALKLATKIRQRQPNALFTVVLTTNQRLDVNLTIDVHLFAASENVSVEFLEQSEITHVLDTTPDGQWLRKEYLGIAAERLSVDLLHRLGQQSLEHFRREVIPPGTSPPVDRSIVDDIFVGLNSGRHGITLLSGWSGFGKSIATLQVLERWLSAGLLGVWLPARIFRDGVTLESALGAWLRELCPDLEPDAGRLAIELAAPSGRLLLCIDDINRERESDRLLRLSVSLVAPLNASRAEVGPEARDSAPKNPLALLVPVWPTQLPLLPPKLLDQPWVHGIHIGPFLPDECIGMIRGNVPRLSDSEARDYADRLGHDPFLVGLFVLMAKDEMDDRQLGAVAADTINQFLETQCREVCASSGVNLLPHELFDVLTDVAREMLAQRSLRPAWTELEDWFGESSKIVRGIRALVAQGQVCKLDSETRLDFRHDRLQERFLVSAMTAFLQSPNLPEEIIADPFYSSIVGKAVANFTTLPAERLTRLRTVAPWVLFEAIRQSGELSSEHHERLFSEARSWAESESRAAPGAVLTAICWSLIETDSTRILPIIDAMEPNAFLMMTGLRNGSASHGMRYIRSMSRNGFEPGIGNSLRETTVERAVHRHGQQIAQQIRNHLSLTDLTATDAAAYLGLLGHLQLPGFDQLIHDVWRRYQDEVWPYAVWASARCPLENGHGLLEALIDEFAQFEIAQMNAEERTKLYDFFRELGWSFRRGMTEEALRSFLQLADRNENLRLGISLIVEGVDHPDAIEFLLRNSLDHAISNLWDTGIGDGELKVKLRSSATTKRLLALWQSPDESDKIRISAFCAWLASTGCKDAALLQAIDPQSPLFPYALQQRIKIGDPSSAADLLVLLRANALDGWWRVLAHRVWCQELRTLASQTLAQLQGSIPADFSGGRSNPMYALSSLLLAIPPADAESLLAEHWGHLKYSSLMIHAAFRIGTPRCAELAKESLALCPADVDIFARAFPYRWSHTTAENPLTLRHLQNLEPYLDRMTHEELFALALSTEEAVVSDESVAEWIQHSLLPLLRGGNMVRLRLSDERLVHHLDLEFRETRFEPHLGILFDEHNGRRLIFPRPERQLRVLDDWLSRNPSVRGLLVAAECLQYIGRRGDLKLLDRYRVEGEAAEIERIKAHARFLIEKRSLV